MKEKTVERINSIIVTLSKMDEETRKSLIRSTGDGLESCWKEGMEAGIKALLRELNKGQTMDKVMRSGVADIESVMSALSFLSKLGDKAHK